MKKNFVFYALVCLTVLGVFGITYAQELTGSEGDYRSTIKKEFNVDPGGLLEMDDISGDITVRTWGKNMVQITEELKMDVYTKSEAEEVLKRSKNKYSQSGKTVSVRGFRARRLKQRFDIMVPTKFNLDLKTSGGEISVQSLEGDVDLHTSGGDIDLSNITGTVAAKTSGGNLDFSDINGVLTAKTSGGSIDLKNIFDDADVSTSGGNIVVMNATKNVTVHTSGGNLRIIEVSGNIKGKTSGGSIDVRGCTGDVNVHTSGGNLNFSQVKGSFEGSTSGGDIEGRDLEEAVNVKTSGGDVDLANVQAPVIAKTSGGNMDVEITLQDFSKPHGVELRTSGGDITLTLPSGIPASITAEIVLNKRSRSMKRYDIFSDFPLSKKQTEEDDKKIIRSTGDINGGGDQVYLRTSGGNIHIKKR